jgi:hypothetical protein
VADIQPRTFVIDPAFARFTRGSAWVFAALALLSAALPFLPLHGRSESSSALYALSIAGCALFALLGWHTACIARRLPRCSISVDDDGLWRTHLGKDNDLVTWNDIESLRESLLLQRLDLLDGIGRRVLSVEYQLNGFELIRTHIIERGRFSSRPVSDPERFSKPLGYHLFHLIFLLGLSAIGIYIGAAIPLLGYGVVLLLLVLIVREYIATALRLTVFRDRLEIRFPLYSRRIERTQIREIRLIDHVNQGVRHMVVGIFVGQHRKPVQLRSLGISATELYRVLAHWQSAPS